MDTKKDKEKIFGKAIPQIIQDIRNPLNIVIGFSSILQIDETINTEIRSYLQNILYSSFKIEDLLSNIDNYFSEEDNLYFENIHIQSEWNRFLKQKTYDINDKEIFNATLARYGLRRDGFESEEQYIIQEVLRRI